MEKEFIGLVNTNRGLIFKICHLYCHDREGRRDLFQEIVLQLWRSYPNFRKQAAGSTWLYRVALNTAISDFRRQKRKPRQHHTDWFDFEIPDPDDEGTDAFNTADLHRAIEKLTDVEKAIIMLYLDEKTYEEIAAIIGISISNAGVRINRIKSKLGKIVKTS